MVMMFLGMSDGEWFAWIVATVAAIAALELKFREERKQMAEQSETPTAEPAGEPAGRQNLDVEAMRRDAELALAPCNGLSTEQVIRQARISTEAADRCAHHVDTLLDALAAANERAGRYREALERLSEGNLESVNWVSEFARRILDSDSQHQYLQPRADAAGAMPDGPGE